MIKATSILFLALLVSGTPLVLTSQTAQKPISQMPASARLLIAVKVIGSKRFPEEAIAAASGLQMGAAVNDDEFKKAARRLGDTGVFTDIGYSFSYSSLGTKVEFKVTDADKFVPVRFEDFVWFTDAEIRHRIKEHSPLFDGELPLSGKLAEEVSDVLQAMLVERSIPGHVDFTRSGKQDSPVDSIVYKVSDVVVQIRNIEFTGAGEAELPALKAASQRLTDHEYSRTLLSAARATSTAARLLLQRLSEGRFRRAGIESCKRAICEQRRRSAKPDNRGRHLRRHSGHSVQDQEPGVVRKSTVHN